MPAHGSQFLRRLTRVLFTTLALGWGACVTAQTFPSKTMRLVVAFPAGGGVDILARLMAPRIGEALGQPMIVDNRPGANGNIGAEIVSRAPPDGHMMMLVVSSFSTNHHFYSKLAFNPLRDFTPVTLLSSAPLVIVSHPSLPVRNLKDLIALAKSRPGQLNCSVAGAGSGGQLTMELFKSMAKINVLTIPYKGGVAAITDAIAGEVHLTLNNPLAIVPHVQAGKLRALGVSTKQRLPALPDVPTVAEAALPGFESSLWYGIVVPAKTPPEIVARLNKEFVRVIQLDEIRQRVAAEGVQIIGSSAEAFGDHLRNESEKWGKVIREAKIRIDG